MSSKLGKILNAVDRRIGFRVIHGNDPVRTFHSFHYLRHNARRLEHLASLRIPVAGMSVLEVGAGIGDHSHYFIDRGCELTITDVRAENLSYLKTRYPHCNVRFLDMERPTLADSSTFDITHCYGLLYHLRDSEKALEFLASKTKRMLFLETCVSFGDTEELNPVRENQINPSQAYSGTGCRPTRPWLFNRLQDLFEYVYTPKTQPNFAEFPLDWTAPEEHQAELSRAIFIASRERLENDILVRSLLNKQSRHE